MLHNVTEVKYLSDYSVWLRFDDQSEGVLDLSKIVRFDGIFEQLKDARKFAEVYVNNELGTICWPNGADLAPETLYINLNAQNGTLTA